MKISAKLKNLRISPRKVRLSAGSIKGLDVSDALVQLENTVKRSSPVIGKLLNSAIANAENNFGLDKDNLYVYNIQVEEGTRLKRWLPRAYGRATQLLKRTSNIIITLEERVEGKGRKSKEQMEKIKKEREETKKKMEKELREQKEKEEKEIKEKEGVDKFLADKEKPSYAKASEGKKGWMKRMFQRKSG